MANRLEYFKQYNLENKEKKKEQRWQKTKDSQLQKLKDELEKTKLENKDWFDSERNPYLNPIKSQDLDKWNDEDIKQFNLQYDIDHFHEREKGDGNTYYKERKEAFRKDGLEKDLKHRIIKWRLFRKTIFSRKNREPTTEECLFNNVYCPKAIQKESEEYRPDLMYLTQIQVDDPYIKVTTAEDWAMKDELDLINGRFSYELDFD